MTGRLSTRLPAIGTVATIVAIVLLGLAPLILSDATLGALEKALVAVLFALAFNLLAGQAGMLSFGHAAYFGFGAFATIHVMVAIEHGGLALPTPLLPLVGAAAGLLSGFVAGYFATLRSGVYFSMVTLAISEFFYTIAPNIAGVFGGESGITSFRQPFGPWTFGSEAQVYSLMLAWVVISGLLLFVYTRTLFGRLTLALRENEKRLPALGFDVHKTKLLVFALSGMFSGIAGSLLAISTESANYTLFSIANSTGVVLNTIIGGTGTFLGPVVGASALTLFGFAASDATHFWLLYQGLIFIAVMLWAPRGITPLLIDMVDAVRQHQVAPARLAVLAGCIVLIALGGALAIELIGAMFDRDHAAAVQKTGEWAPILAIGMRWVPSSPITWATPIVMLALGVAMARFGRTPTEVRSHG